MSSVWLQAGGGWLILSKILGKNPGARAGVAVYETCISSAIAKGHISPEGHISRAGFRSSTRNSPEPTRTEEKGRERDFLAEMVGRRGALHGRQAAP